MVDWYYIFSILELGVYPPPKAIYNVHKFISFFLTSVIHKKVGPINPQFSVALKEFEKNSIRRAGIYEKENYDFIVFWPSKNPLSNIFKLTSRNFWGVTRSTDALSFSWEKGNLG